MSTPETRRHLNAIAEILAELADDIELIGASLCKDPEFVEGRFSELQGIDLIAQKQKSLATLLRADCPVTALEQIGLEELRGRLLRLTGEREDATLASMTN